MADYFSSSFEEHRQPEGTPPEPLQVVVVMDGLKEFSWEPLEWVLKNVADRASSSCNVTLLGVKPWLNIPLSSKTWSDIWSIEQEDLAMTAGRNDAKYHKLRVLLDICQHYGVVLEIRTEMGHPLHLLVVEQISSLHATLVVFDRHHDRKFIEFYAERLPCKMVKMKEDGEVETIKTRCTRSADSTPRNDDVSFQVNVAPSSRSVIFSQKIKKFLKSKYARESKQQRDDHDHDHDHGHDDRSVHNRVVRRRSKSVVLIEKLLKRKYESFGKNKNTETAAPFGMCNGGISEEC